MTKTNNTIIEGNKKIAEFFGMRLESFQTSSGLEYEWLPSQGHSNWCFQNPPPFNSSWSWLMPVVLKIFSLNLKKKGEQLFVTESDHYTTPIQNSLTVGIKPTFEAVVKFINWYNSLTPTQEG